MIARLWRGWSPTWDADALAGQLSGTVVRCCRGTPGNRAAYLLRRGDGDRTEFLVLSFWESLDAVAAVVGEDLERAAAWPDERFHVEPEVIHYAVWEGRTE